MAIGLAKFRTAPIRAVLRVLSTTGYLLLTLGDVIFHFFLDEVGAKDDRQGPVLVLADRDQDVILLEEVNLFGPALDASVAVRDTVAGC